MKFLHSFFRRRPRVELTDIQKRFDLVGRVGQGSMSKVWRARDLQTGRNVALKVLDKAKTLRLESRFTGLKKPTEGEIAIQLKHPHIVETYEFGTTTNHEQFLVMEFVEGVSLSFLIEMQNAQLKNNRLRFMIELAEAIEYFHRANWIHRDICPRNVLINQDNSIKLIDFGLVVPNTAEFRRPGNRTGTANYMAPELIKRLKTDQRIDVFSYSVTCYEMLTKTLPWDAAETLEAVLQHINTPAKDIRKILPKLDEQVAEAIMRGLATYPDDRWSTISEMLSELRTANQRLRAASGS